MRKKGDSLSVKKINKYINKTETLAWSLKPLFLSQDHVCFNYQEKNS